MLHLLYFVTRKAGMDSVKFSNYWRYTHGPIARKIPGLMGYVQSRAVAENAVGNEYDGVAEAWVESEAALKILLNSAEYERGALVDEANFIDKKKADVLLTNDRVVIDQSPRPGMVKTVTCVRRRPGLSVAEFRDYWFESHGPIAKTLPGIRRYVQNVTTDTSYAKHEPRWDGVSQIWVDNAEALKIMRSSRIYTEDAMSDAKHFLDIPALSMFVATETTFIDPELR